MKIRGLLAVMLVLSFVGCHKGSKEKGENYTKIDFTSIDEDFVIPTSVWKNLENSYPELTVMVAPPKGEGEGEGKGESKEKEKVKKKEDPNKEEAKKEQEDLLKRRPTLDGLKFKTLLVEKTEGILDNQNYEISYGSGGGTLDLKDYYPEKKNGTFFLKVNYDQPMDPKKTKVYYISNAQVRPDFKMGSGCNKYFDITKFWARTMKDDGLNLNTVNMRHLSVVAGTFLFVSPFQGKLRLGHLTIKDSRHPELLCKPEIKN